MKKLVLLFLIILSINARAQKGFEIRLDGGLGFLGQDPWIETGFLTGTVLYNINGIFALGPSYTQGVNTTFRIDNDQNQVNASLNEFGVLVQLTFVRSGKFKVYGTTSLGYIQGKSDPVNDYITGQPGTITPEDSSMAFGIGAGALFFLGGGFYFNIIDFQMRFLNSEFMDMDKGFSNKIGPGISIKTGFSFSF